MSTKQWNTRNSHTYANTIVSQNPASFTADVSVSVAYCRNVVVILHVQCQLYHAYRSARNAQVNTTIYEFIRSDTIWGNEIMEGHFWNIPIRFMCGYNSTNYMMRFESIFRIATYWKNAALELSTTYINLYCCVAYSVHMSCRTIHSDILSWERLTLSYLTEI